MRGRRVHSYAGFVLSPWNDEFFSQYRCESSCCLQWLDCEGRGWSKFRQGWMFCGSFGWASSACSCMWSKREGWLCVGWENRLPAQSHGSTWEEIEQGEVTKLSMIYSTARAIVRSDKSFVDIMHGTISYSSVFQALYRYISFMIVLNKL